MQVENIECQIAQAQIGSFLSGSGLSDEAVRQLEEHIAGCVHCKSVLSERRDALKAMLTGKQAVVDFEEIAREAEATKAKSIAMALRKKSLEQMLQPAASPAQPSTPEPKPIFDSAPAVESVDTPSVEQAFSSKRKGTWKPLAYSCALAGVLVAMSLFAGNVDKILGPKADAASVPVAVTPSPNASPTEVVTAESQATTPPSLAPVSNPINPSEPAPAAATEPPVEAVDSPAAIAIGGSAGLLATTQFQSAESTEVQAQAAAKVPAQIAPSPRTRRTVNRRATRRQTPRRVTPRRPAKSNGIKVYNP